MDKGKALERLREEIQKEKLRLDYILRGAELLVEMLASEEQSGTAKETKQHSESGLEKAAGSKETTDG